MEVNKDIKISTFDIVWSKLCRGEHMDNSLIHFDILTNDEGVSFDNFIKRLFELYRDCNHEHYFSEIFIPFLRTCSPDGVKIIPIFDDRKTGRKTENETEAKKRMSTICAMKNDGTYVVPDYIFVPDKYSFNKPCKPYLMVETKKPIFLKDGEYYQNLGNSIHEYESELFAEIESCGCLIYTDGITWMFLEIEEGEIVESKKYKTICFVNLGEAFYKTNKATVKKGVLGVDLSVIGEQEATQLLVEPHEWKTLKGRIKQIVNDKKL